MSSATASASGSATSALWKWNSNPPTAADVCSNGPTGNSSRGSVTFTRTCSASPTISVTITVTSGPALSGTNARDVYILQSNTTGGCLQQTLAGVYNSANGIGITIGPTPIISGATFFSVTMLQSGGGGTDTYTTNRVNLTC